MMLTYIKMIGSDEVRDYELIDPQRNITAVAEAIEATAPPVPFGIFSSTPAGSFHKSP